MNLFFLLGCGLLGLAVTWALIPLIERVCRAWGLLQPSRDLHHTHRVPVLRLGGVALAAAFVAVLALARVLAPEPGGLSREHAAMLFCPLAMFALGFWDDLRPLGAVRKLLAQILISAAVPCFGVGIQTVSLPFGNAALELGWLGYVATVLWLVSFTNLINLVDGIDGLAGGICLMLMVLLAYVSQEIANIPLLAAGMAGALLGFLRYNFPPARIYMGDGGAYFLGFLIGLATIVSSQKGTVAAALIAPLFVLALPIVDTALAIVRRGWYGLPIFRPDRQHIHHRLVATGASRRKVVLGIYSFTAVFLVMGFAAFWSKGFWIPSLAGLGVLIILLCAGWLNFSREWFSVGRVLGNSLQVRQEIQHTLTLANWLALDGERSPAIAGLWDDLVFAAQKMGFCLVRLRLEDEERVWQLPEQACDCRTMHREFLNGPFGTLVLGTRLGGEDSGGPGALPHGTDKNDPSAFATGETRGFAVTGELLAEGWLKAARRWHEVHQLPVRFTPLPA